MAPDRQATFGINPTGITSAASTPRRRGDGDAPVNIRELGNYNLDLSMSKTFALGHRRTGACSGPTRMNALKVDTRTLNVAATFDPPEATAAVSRGRLVLQRSTRAS